MAKEKKETAERKEVKSPTLKERVSDVVDKNYEDKDELKKSIFDLVQRVLYPDQFCPECNDRLFISGNEYKCLNCGFTKPVTTAPTTPSALIRTDTQPTQPVQRPTGKVPEQVERAIAEAEKNSDIRAANVSGKGKRIQELADQLGDSSVPPTKEDENILKSVDPNVRDINWV
jgi:hypothetical protein